VVPEERPVVGAGVPRGHVAAPGIEFGAQQVGAPVVHRAYVPLGVVHIIFQRIGLLFADSLPLRVIEVERGGGRSAGSVRAQNAGEAILRVVDVAVRIVAQQIPRRVVSITRGGNLIVRGVEAEAQGRAGRPLVYVFHAAHVPKGAVRRPITVTEGKPHDTQAVPWLPACLHSFERNFLLFQSFRRKWTDNL